ncbi:MAG: DUF927 domain-containing protein [Trichlorobacter sp.]|nr:DUF927 domain-containing protein [Trichlorobacter sp.]
MNDPINYTSQALNHMADNGIEPPEPEQQRLTLAPAHLEDLRKSGLSDATIKKAGFESIRPCDISKETGLQLADVDSAYRIPFDEGYNRFKLFYKTEPKPGQKQQKYVQKKGTPNRLYIPVLLDESELDGLETLYITEGEKKALKATQEGLPCIGITGLWNWKVKGSDELIRDFNRLNLVGRNVKIVPDSDWLDLDKNGKPKNLKSAVFRLARSLMVEGAIVSVVYLPDDPGNGGKVGLDDYLLNHSVDEFLELEQERAEARKFCMNKRGELLLYQPDDEAGRYKPPFLISSAIEIRAATRDSKNESWGKLIGFKDADNKEHYWIMPMRLFAGCRTEIKEALFDKGIKYISPNPTLQQELMNYLQFARPHNGKRLRTVTQTGWQGEGLFIFPGGTIGRIQEEEIAYQGDASPVTSHAGTFAEWRENVSKYCTGNSRLTLAVSLAFTGPLLYLLRLENFGLNLFGNTSIGKSTALLVACSVWGGRDFMQTWRATDNGLEGIASQYSDLFLALDEMGEIEPKTAGNVAYMLANGQGKKRANRKGDARAEKRWRLCFLGTGEVTLAEHIRAGGGRVKAGQEVRLADVPADTGQYGIFETLHGFDDGGKLSQHLKNNALKYYGTAGLNLLECITDDWLELEPTIKSLQSRFVSAYCPPNAEGQVKRVAGFFGLVAAAGEYATDKQITGWQPGDAVKAAGTCFKDWLTNRGGAGAKEVERILEDLALFIENHGCSRFADKSSDRVIINRAGMAEPPVYYFLPETFRAEVLKGHNFRFACKTLADLGILLPPGDDKGYQQKHRMDGDPQNFYVIDAEKLRGVIDDRQS